MDSWEPADLDELERKPKVAWEEISPENLRRSALSEDVDEGPESGSLAGRAGMAWFEVILGALLGLASAIALWWWSDGGLSVFILIPAPIIGGLLMIAKRRDVKYLGYGLLVSPVMALVLGLAFWYLALFA